MSDGAYLWAFSHEESDALAKAIAPLGKYIPIELPGNPTQLMKDLKPLVDVLSQALRDRIAVELLIRAANTPAQPPPPEPSYTQTQPVQPAQPLRTVNTNGAGAEPVPMTPGGYDLTQDRRRSL